MNHFLQIFLLSTIISISFQISSSGIHGVNWADVRDNYANDELILSGLTISDSYEVIKQKAKIILNTFISEIGANTVRIPINPPTVNGQWWDKYKGAIDQALEMNMNVILAYWEGPNGKDGKVDDLSTYWEMWKIVTQTYTNQKKTFFEIMNEPFGYSKNDWAIFCSKWLERYNVPHGRVLIGGTGYDDSVIEMGNDSTFSDCLLSQHIYPFWNEKLTTEAQWTTELQKRIGRHASRTIITEFGTEMDKTHGTFDYSIQNSKDHRIAFMRAIAVYIHDNNMGCTVWPGLRNGDSYSIFALKGSGLSISLVKNNESVIPLLKYAFGLSSSFNPSGGAANVSSGNYKIKNVNSGLYLDVKGGSTEGAAEIVQKSSNNQNSQKWSVKSLNNGFYNIVNVNSGMNLDVNGESLEGGEHIIQWHGNDANNQHWKFIQDGSYYFIVNQNSGLYLDVNQSSKKDNENIIQWHGNGDNNQKWALEKA